MKYEDHRKLDVSKILRSLNNHESKSSSTCVVYFCTGGRGRKIIICFDYFLDYMTVYVEYITRDKNVTTIG